MPDPLAADIMTDPDDRKRAADDEFVEDRDDFEAMTDRVLALPPQDDED